MTTPSRRTAQRLAGIPPTIFATMSALARRTGAINLGQGFPDHDGPPAVIDAAIAAMRGGRNQYPPDRGIPALRAAVARHQQANYGIRLDPDTEVVITAGATEAIAASILGLVDPGDEVIALEPFYDSYVACIEMAGGVRRSVTLRAPGFRLDEARLRAAVTPCSKLLVVNLPHNPTGAVLEESELESIARVAVEHDLVVVTDEVYEHLVFDGRRHIPLATLPGMFERTITISSAGKAFSFTGWKVGWATGPADLVATVLAAKQWLTFTNAAPLQPAIAVALDTESGFHERLAVDLQSKRDLLCEGLAVIGLDVYRPRATYFVMTDVRSLGYDDALAFCLALPERAGVVAIPAQVFYDDREEGQHKVRWAFCKERATLEEALERLAGTDLTA